MMGCAVLSWAHPFLLHLVGNKTNTKSYLLLLISGTFWQRVLAKSSKKCVPQTITMILRSQK